MKNLGNHLAAVLVATALTLSTAFTLLVAVPQPALAAPAAAYGSAAQKTTNAQRLKRDLPKVKADKCLRKHARKHARRLAEAGRIWHQDIGKVMRQCGLRSVGENVAYGYPTGRKLVNRGWMKSPGHRANILRRSYRLGVVVARRDDSGTWFAVQLFGSR
jgi:uncharacterized protein YkwD